MYNIIFLYNNYSIAILFKWPAASSIENVKYLKKIIIIATNNTHTRNRILYKDTSINRTLSFVTNVTFVNLTTS